MTLLLIAEHDNKELKPSNYHCLAAAKQLNENIDVLIIGHQCQAVAEQASKMPGIKDVYLADNAVYEHQLAENTARLIADFAGEYQYIISSAGTFGKNLMPRVSALLDSQMISDITKVVSTNTFERPIYAGNVVATVQSDEKCKVITVRASAFEMTKGDNSAAQIKPVDEVIENTLSQFKDQQLTKSSRPELSDARVIVSGGRGLKSAENFKLLESLADRLSAAIGASRAAVDAGFVPNDYQVGQTGKIVAPELYIAIGISGAIQHLAGMKDSKVIVAINNDPEAPIFEVSDYGIVGDLFKILPELESELDKVSAA